MEVELKGRMCGYRNYKLKLWCRRIDYFCALIKHYISPLSLNLNSNLAE